MQLIILGKVFNTLNTSKATYTYFLWEKKYKKYCVIQYNESSIANNQDLVKNNNSLLMILSDGALLKMLW